MKIVIAGFGVEGEENLAYWSKDLDNQLVIADQRQPSRPIPDGVETIIGDDAFERLDGFDLVVRTAGLAPHKIKTDGKIRSGTNEFFEKCPATIIGVTGTKGKGTTASLIASILEAAGLKVWLVGNIGTPALSILSDVQPKDIVVYELSSFQLWDIERSPQTAVLLHIEGDHLDVHANMDEYVSAKANITKFQSDEDLLIYNQSNTYASKIADESAAKKVGYPDAKTAHVQSGRFWYGERSLCTTSSLKLVGPHNQDNACAAIDAVWGYTNDAATIERGLSSFEGLPHRLKFVREVGGVDYYDDSISTTPGSAIAALKSFDRPKVIILGGSSKGMNFKELGQELAAQSSVRALLVGDEADKIALACEAAGFKGYEKMGTPTMTELVNRAAELAEVGAVVLLSPACASFGMFLNYQDRGDQFISAVEALGKKR